MAADDVSGGDMNPHEFSDDEAEAMEALEQAVLAAHYR